MIHLTLQQLSAYLDGELTDASIELVRRHLSECDACTVNFARIEGQEEILARVLVDEPDDDFFQQMSASIAATIGGRVKPAATKAEHKSVKPAPSAKPKSTKNEKREPVAETKPAKRDDVAPKLEDRHARPQPRRAADESALPAVTPTPLPVVPAEPLIPPTPLAPPEPATITVPLERPSSLPLARQPEARGPEQRQPHPRRRETDVEPKRSGGAGAPTVWIAAAVVLVLLGSVAWVLTHRGSSAPHAPSGEGTPAPSTAETTAPGASVPEPSAPEEANPSEVDTPTAPAAAAAPVTSSAPQESPATSDVATTDTTTPEPEPTPPPTPAPKRALPKPVKKAPPTPAARTEEPERLVDRPTQNVVPVRTFVTEKTYSTFDGDAPSQASPPPPSQPSAAVVAAQEAAVRKKLIDDAKRASLRAVQSMEAPSFDDAAVAWEKALPVVENAPEDQALVRRELAQARFQAWAKTPTAARKEAAVTAARAYLMYAPPGPDRDQAWTWLGRLKQP